MYFDRPDVDVIARTDDWIIETGLRYGPRMVLTADWSDAAVRAWERHRVRELELNYAKGWQGGDLSFLGELPALHALLLTDWDLEDSSVVNELDELRYLKLSTYCETEIRFDRLPNLEVCSLEWRPTARTLFEHRGIKKLFVNRLVAGGDFRPFANMTSLRALTLYTPRLSSLDGIGSLSGLEFLEIARSRTLSSLSGLEALSNLAWMEVSTCRKISDVSPVGELPQLRTLLLGDLGDIASIRPLSCLRKLERLFLLESTCVLDGDLSPLLELPRLEHVVFEDRPGYSHRADDFPELPIERIVDWRKQATRKLDERILGPVTGAVRGTEGAPGSENSLRAYIDAEDIDSLLERVRELTGIQDVEWLDAVPPVARYDDRELHPERAIRVVSRVFAEMKEYPGDWWMGEFDAEGTLHVWGVYGDSLETAVRSH